MNDYFGEIETPPYLYTSTASQAFRELYESIGEESGVKPIDIPVPQTVMYFVDTIEVPKIITPKTQILIETLRKDLSLVERARLLRDSGLLTLNFYLGGVLIPEERIKNDSEEEILAQLTQEEVRTKLRCKSPVYDLVVYNPLLQLTEDFVSGAITCEILGVLTEDFVEIFYRNRKISEQYFPGFSLKREILEEVINKLREMLKENDPIKEGCDILKSITGIEVDSFYNQFSRVTLKLKRRNINGVWEEIVLPKLSRVLKPQIIKRGLLSKEE